MAVQVWIGEKPEHPNERRTIVALANGLERLDGLYLILANFSVGGRNMDLVIIKQDAVFIIELKHCDGKIFGGVNGHWYVESANGERKRLNPGRRNPYNQVISYFYSLTNFLNEHRSDFLSAQKATLTDFRTCRRVVVIAPTIQEGSEIALDWKVELKGLDELPAFLVTERSSEIDLTEDEMLAIPKMLYCTRWKEIDSLIAGVLPNWQSVAQSETPGAETPAAAPVEPSTPPKPAAASGSASASLFERVVVAVRTPAGRVAAIMSTLALVLFVLLLVRPAQAIPNPDQPLPFMGTPDPGTGGVFLSSGETTGDCIWSDFQTIGWHWDRRSKEWIGVQFDDATATQNPDIMMTLEQVAHCTDQITLTLSVRNNSTQDVELPLRNDNIIIRDQLGNEYAISDSQSRPSVLLRIGPGEQESGTIVVPRPLSQNASSLIVRLKEQPFDNASFFVSLADS
ncbi:MAG: NERD domain-containing protein [Chloroflexales bacterium]|nr:NERD domain-containing protein [Chloroflexales bacterium]